MGVYDTSVSLRAPLNYYGLVTSLIIIPTSIIFIPLLLFQFKSPYLTYRSPALVFICNLSYLFVAGGRAIIYVTYPDSGCELVVLGDFLIYSTYGFTVLMRAWLFGFKYDATISQVQQPAKLISWVLKHKWILSGPVLTCIWMVSFCAHMIPPLVFLSQPDRQKTLTFVGCLALPDGYNLIMPIFYCVMLVILAFKLHPSKDGYHVRDELRAISIVWMTTIVLITVFSNLSEDVQYWIPAYVFVQFGYIFSFFVSTVWVWWLAWRHSVAQEAIKNRMRLEMEVLSFPLLIKEQAFRGKFMNFLCLQFCVENLLFWEAVQEYHTIAPQRRAIEAKIIYDKYLSKDAPYELNLPMTIKKAVESQLKENVIADTIFDDAEEHVMTLMEQDSYPRYLTSQEDNIPSSPRSSPSVSLTTQFSCNF